MVNPALYLFYTALYLQTFSTHIPKIFYIRPSRHSSNSHVNTTMFLGALWDMACWNKTLYIEISNIPFTWQYKINLQTI